MALNKSESQLADKVGNPLIGSRQNAVSISVAAVDTSDTYSDAALNAAIAEVNTALESIVAVLVAHGLVEEEE